VNTKRGIKPVISGRAEKKGERKAAERRSKRGSVHPRPAKKEGSLDPDRERAEISDVAKRHNRPISKKTGGGAVDQREKKKHDAQGVPRNEEKSRNVSQKNHATAINSLNRRTKKTGAKKNNKRNEKIKHKTKGWANEEGRGKGGGTLLYFRQVRHSSRQKGTTARSQTEKVQKQTQNAC